MIKKIVESSPVTARITEGTALALGACLLLSGCGSAEKSADQDRPQAPASSSASNANRSKDPEPTPERTPKPPEMPLASETSGKWLAAIVCDGFFAQKRESGNWELVGRPLVDASGNPTEVDANQSGVSVRTLPKQSGEVQWFDFDGHKTNKSDITCDYQQISSSSLTQPNGSTIWVAKSSLDKPAPRVWDANSLNPEGFAGVGLDYGEVSTFDLCDVLTQVARKAHTKPECL